MKAVVLGKRPLRKLLSYEQQALFKQHAPRGLTLDALKPLGPINVVKLKFTPRAMIDRTAVAEVWLYPDGSRILELSMKCAPEEVLALLARTHVILQHRGITLTGTQETKTHKALQYFSRLQAGRHN